MDNKFSNDMASVFNFSREEAERTECDNVSPEHLLLGMLRQNVSKATRLMHQVQPDLISLKRHLERMAHEKKVEVVPDKNSMELNRDATRLMRLSILEARAQHSEEVDTEHLLKAMLKDQGSPIQQLLEEHGLTREKLYGETRSGYSQTDDDDDDQAESNKGYEMSGGQESDSPTLTKKKAHKSGTPVLDNFCIDLTEKARKGELDPVVGREKEMERVAQILARRKKNNPILIGEPGVGKSAIVEGLAQRIVERKVASQLWGKRILTLDMAGMVAGTKFRGQFEERVRNLLMELEANPDVIIYIDEIHTIIGAGGSQGSMDAANMLKPALARGQMQCIGATTIDEFRKTIEKDGALERRFQKIIVAQSTAEETLQILHRLRPAYEKHHKVKYTDEALEACVHLTQRYVSDRSFPDKAIDAMDESGARMHIFNIPANMEIDNLETELRDIEERKNMAIKAQNYETAADLRDELQMKTEQLEQLQKAWVEQQEKNYTEVTAETVAQVVSIMTGIPAHRIGDEENSRLRLLEQNLKGSVVGQDDAVLKVTRAIQRSRVGLKDPNRPIGTFLFVGPTGVGKTYLTKRLAMEMFGSEASLIRIDMSEYGEKHTVSRMMGAPPGYVGYEEGGQLTERVRRKPYSIVLLDEIEKAHPDVFNILLQVMDEGRLTDGNGTTIDFRNTVIIMTSNSGTRQIKDFGTGIGFQAMPTDEDRKKQTRSIVEKALKKQFAPEFLNRLDDIVFFDQLSQDDIRRITDIELRPLLRRIKEMGYTLELSEDTIRKIATEGYDVQYGARPLRRAIQRIIEDPICEMLLSDKTDGISEDKVIRL
ncbi:MAG: ATP-dependent Clp protease ATP-binding subunit [Bacteroidaceae bacterium]|nr:ATP-dependent Clp protease ATP-binding subunit [Bacteroidaceae bacterium]